jgi:Transcriptional regulators
VSVTDEAIVRIRELITSGRINPGDRLPPEQDLATMLGISRSSLREAVKALSQARVLDVRRGDGTYVTSLEPDLLLSGMSFVVDLMQDSTLVQVFKVRKLLEPAATALAAQRISSEQVQELRDSLKAMREAHDPEELVMRDI